MWKLQTEVSQVIRRTPSIKSFQFPRTKQMQFKAGQFFYVTIKLNGNEATHHFSFSTSPTDLDYIEFTKRITSSEYSRALDRLEPGAAASLEGPDGSFTLPNKPQRLAFLSGGIGITPLRSMLRFIVHKQIPHNVVLLFGNSAPGEIPFHEELDGMAASHPAIRVEHVLSGTNIPEDWKGRRGLIDREIISELIPDYAERLFYISGPPRMVESLQSQLGGLGVPEKRVKTDSFSGY